MKQLLFALAMVLFLPFTHAQTSTAKDTIPMVSTGGPGGFNSILIFGLQSPMGKILDTSLPIDYKAGGNGTIAVNHLLNHGKDRTMLLVMPWHVATNQALRNDLKPVVYLGESSQIVVIKPDSKITNFVELINQRKKLTVGFNPTTPLDILFKEVRKQYPTSDIVPVPYRSGAEVVTALLGGHIDVAITPAPVAIQHITAGTLAAIANVADERSPLLPNVTTLSEQGINWKFEQYMGLAWFMVASQGTSDALIQQIRNELGAWMQTADGKAFLTKHDLPFRNRHFASPALVLQRINGQ